jgi:organic hydroperoxide reductase OsmC/OhrA
MEEPSEVIKTLKPHIKIFWEGGIKTTSLMRGFEIVADGPKWKYGTNSAPAPGEVFLASIGACFTTTFTKCAQENRAILDAVYSDVRSTMTHEKSGKERILEIEIVLKAHAEEEYKEVLQNCFEEAKSRCPLINAVKCDIQLKYEFAKE